MKRKLSSHDRSELVFAISILLMALILLLCTLTAMIYLVIYELDTVLLKLFIIILTGLASTILIGLIYTVCIDICEKIAIIKKEQEK